MEVDEQDITVDKELFEFISSGIAKKMSNNDSSFWHNKMTMGDEISNAKPISISAFTKSITPFISAYIKFCGHQGHISKSEIDGIEKDIAGFLEVVWSIVISKWKQCFMLYDVQFHKKEFNICKGVGVFSIHGLIKECFDETGSKENLNKNIVLDQTLSSFKKIIEESNVQSDWWRVGGPFTGLSSGQGFKQIISYIKNEEKFF
jgi:hypothetical protein